MRIAVIAAIGLLGVTAIGALPPASAGGLDCNARGLSQTEATICQDTQLSRLDAQLARRFDGFARRMSFGQYLGLRYWQAEATRLRNLCSMDRGCIAAHYRAQTRFLDRLQQCLDASLSRRACLRSTLSSEREALRR